MRKILRWLARLGVLVATLAALAFALAVLATRYVYQEPAGVAWSEHLLHKFLEQR